MIYIYIYHIYDREMKIHLKSTQNASNSITETTEIKNSEKGTNKKKIQNELKVEIKSPPLLNY